MEQTCVVSWSLSWSWVFWTTLMYSLYMYVCICIYMFVLLGFSWWNPEGSPTNCLPWCSSSMGEDPGEDDGCWKTERICEAMDFFLGEGHRPTWKSSTDGQVSAAAAALSFWVSVVVMKCCWEVISLMFCYDNINSFTLFCDHVIGYKPSMCLDHPFIEMHT